MNGRHTTSQPRAEKTTRRPTPRLPLAATPPIKSHLEKEETRVCAYCGRLFAQGEIAIEKEIHGRRWRFCSEECYQDFMDAVHFRDQDLDGYKQEGNITVGEKEDDED